MSEYFLKHLRCGDKVPIVNGMVALPPITAATRAGSTAGGDKPWGEPHGAAGRNGEERAANREASPLWPESANACHFPFPEGNKWKLVLFVKCGK